MPHPIQFDESVHRYTVDGKFKPSVTQVLEAAGMIDLAGIDPSVLLRAAERGTKVHKAGSLLLLNLLDWSTVDEAIGGYVRALDSFLRHTGFNPLRASVERPLYCAQYDFCGTPDVVGTYAAGRSGILTVLDWKTGMMTAVRYQLAAYAHALGVRHRCAVKLNKNGTYRTEWFPPETMRFDLDVFLKALDDTRHDERFAA